MSHICFILHVSHECVHLNVRHKRVSLMSVLNVRPIFCHQCISDHGASSLLVLFNIDAFFFAIENVDRFE